jgi:hypothetical protein
LVGYIERIVAVADTHDYGAHMAPKIAAATSPAANLSRPIAAIVARSEITVEMDRQTVDARLQAAAIPLESRIEVKTALMRAGWLPRAEAPGTVHAGHGTRECRARLCRCWSARSSPRRRPARH